MVRPALRWSRERGTDVNVPDFDPSRAGTTDACAAWLACALRLGHDHGGRRGKAHTFGARAAIGKPR